MTVDTAFSQYVGFSTPETSNDSMQLNSPVSPRRPCCCVSFVLIKSLTPTILPLETVPKSWAIETSKNAIELILSSFQRTSPTLAWLCYFVHRGGRFNIITTH